MNILALNNQSPAQQIEQIMSGKNPLHAIHALSPQDILFAIREKGLTDSLEFLSHLSVEQVQGIIDIDCWVKGRIHPLKIGNLFSALMAADKRKAIKQFLEQDLELISLLFKLHTKVYDLSAEEEPEDASVLHSITPDRKYFIAFKGTSETFHIAHFLHQVIEDLYARDMEFVLRLVESLRWELPAVLEDEALRWREGRLLDLGFPTDQEAHEAMIKLNPKNLRKKIAEAGHVEHASVMLMRKIDEEQGMLAQALPHLSQGLREEIAEQLCFLSNAVALAQGNDWGDFQCLQSSAHYVIEMIDVALDYLCKEQSLTVDALLQQHAVRDLFKVGRFVVENS